MIDMIEFWLLAGLLLVAALSFVWWPILAHRRRAGRAGVSREDLNIQAFESQVADLQAERQAGRIDATQFAALKAEHERNLLGDVTHDQHSAASKAAHAGKRLAGRAGFIGAGFSLLVLVAALGLYSELGRHSDLQQMAQQQALSEQLSTLAHEQQIEVLEQEAKRSPQQADVWYALANGYFQMGRYQQATDAYDRLLALVGEQPDLLSEYAQVMFFISGNKVTPPVQELIKRTLAVQADNATALGLLGIDAYENGRYADAINAWHRALESTPHAQASESLRQGIARARQLLAEQSPETARANKTARANETARANNTAQANEAAQARLIIDVALAESLKAKVSPEHTVFVFARASQGSPMPLAAQRLKVKDLPAQILLSDAMAMTPAANLSSAEQVEVVARVSLSGQPQPRAGDLQGSFGPVKVGPGQAPIKLLIERVVE